MKLELKFESEEEASQVLKELVAVNLSSKEEIEKALSERLVDILTTPAVRRFLRTLTLKAGTHI